MPMAFWQIMYLKQSITEEVGATAPTSGSADAYEEALPPFELSCDVLTPPVIAVSQLLA